MTISENITVKRVKIKFSSKIIGADPDKEFSKLGQGIFMNNGCNESIPRHGEGKLDDMHSSVVHSFRVNKKNTFNGLKVKLPLLGKRSCDSEGLDFRKEKRVKVDRAVKQMCCGILRTLMNHKCGWAFRRPVDPVRMNIPDYFSIITNPMDLGSVKQKLEADLYSTTEEFVADVRLTFSNAMLYNPPQNSFHAMAEELNNIFNERWKLVEGNSYSRNIGVEQECMLNGRMKNSQDMKHSQHKKSLTHVRLLPKWSISSKEKQKLKKNLVEVLKGHMTVKLRSFLENLGLMIKRKGDVDLMNIDVFDEEDLLELKRLVKDSLKSRTEKVEPTKVTQNDGRFFHEKNDSGSENVSASSNNRQPLSSIVSVCGSCGTLICQCRPKIQDLSSSNYICSPRLSRKDQLYAYKKDCEELVPVPLPFHMKEDGVTSAMDKNFCGGPEFSSAASGECCNPLIDVQLSPKKALRAVMLKRRFAYTILKAREKTLLEHGDKVDRVKMQQEKERLERQQLEEKVRIEAQIRAAEASSQRKAEAEFKMQRERERLASRTALQKMVKTVTLCENQEFLKDVEMYIFKDGCYSRKPLEQLGLFIKDDDYTEIEYEHGRSTDEVALQVENEDGEIIS